MGLQDEIDQYYWWHTIVLEPGLITPGIKSQEMMTKEANIIFGGVDLRDKSVLDVGAWTGGFSIEAKRRGARRVVALDNYTWNHPNFRGREAFDFAVRASGLEIEAVDLDLDAKFLCMQHLGKFDVVLFLGVFYHLLDPIAVTKEVASLAGHALVLESYLTDFEDPVPHMTFYPGSELVGDPTNWWGPNRKCVESLLNVFGFPTVIYSQGANESRGIFHAHR